MCVIVEIHFFMFAFSSSEFSDYCSVFFCNRYRPFFKIDAHAPKQGVTMLCFVVKLCVCAHSIIRVDIFCVHGRKQLAEEAQWNTSNRKRTGEMKHSPRKGDSGQSSLEACELDCSSCLFLGSSVSRLMFRFLRNNPLYYINSPFFLFSFSRYFLLPATKKDILHLRWRHN